MRAARSRVLFHLAAVVIILCSSATARGEGQKGGEPASPPLKEIGELIKKLGSEAFEERDAAEKKLAKIGAAAKGHLATAAKNKDPEVARRAGAILAAIHKEEMATIERDVLKAEEEYRVAKLKNDTKALNRLLADHFYETNQNGNSRDKAATIRLWTDFKITSLVIDKSQVRSNGNTAVVSGTMTEDNATGQDRMLFLRTYEKTKSGWILVACMQFRDPK